jgi:hypothetical protein
MIARKVVIETHNRRYIEFVGDLKTMLYIKQELKKPNSFLVIGDNYGETTVTSAEVKRVEYQYYDERMNL